jgi:hypothetical protein
MSKRRALLTVLNGGVRYEVPAYANAGGTGDRQSIITVTTNFVSEASPTDYQKLVDGLNANPANMYWSNQNFANKYFQFEFTARVKITEMKYYFTTGYSEGIAKATLQVKGSNNGTDFANIGAAATPSFANPAVISAISANVIAYKHYQVLVTSGVLDAGEYELPHEWQFKIANPI